MPSAPKKPERLVDLYNALQRYYDSTNAVRADSKRMYYGEAPASMPQLPQGIPVYRSSRGKNIIDNLADQIRVDEPAVTFISLGPSIKATANKDLMERWGQRVLEEMPRHARVNPAVQSKIDMSMMAAACVKHIIDESVLPDAPEREGSRTAKEHKEAMVAWKEQRAYVWPWVIRPVDPMNVFPSPGSLDPPLYVLEVQTRRAIDMWLQYPDWPDPIGQKSGQDAQNPMRPVQWLEYWDKNNYIVECDGAKAIDEPNKYNGDIPYKFRYNGRGRLDSSGDPKYMGEGLLESVMGELIAEVRTMTAMDAAWQFHVFERLQVPQGQGKKAAKQMQVGPGAIIELPGDMSQEYRWLQHTPPNETMMRYMDKIDQRISDRYPPAVNQRPVGVEAAVHQAALIGQALKPLAPIRAAMSDLYTDLLNGMARQFVAMKLEMSVFGADKEKVERGRIITHSDFKAFNFRVEFDATTPEEDDRRLLVGRALLESKSSTGIPVISRQTFRERFASKIMPDSLEEEVRIATEATVDMLLAAGWTVEAAMEEAAGAAQEEQQGQLADNIQGRIASEVPGARERALEGAAGVPIPRSRGQAEPGVPI